MKLFQNINFAKIYIIIGANLILMCVFKLFTYFIDNFQLFCLFIKKLEREIEKNSMSLFLTINMQKI